MNIINNMQLRKSFIDKPEINVPGFHVNAGVPPSCIFYHLDLIVKLKAFQQMQSTRIGLK